MNVFIVDVISAAIGTILLFVSCFLSGTILYFIWPTAVQAIFPGLVRSGAISGDLGWWQAVCVTWVAGILLKSSVINNKD